jgi:hypothetical protein
MPNDVMEYCVDREISTHYQNDVAFVPDGDNPFANWLREIGYQFEDNIVGCNYVGIIAT